MASQDQPTYVKRIDFNQPITEDIATGYIAWQLSVYKSQCYRDYNLWEAFIEDFEGFEKQIFNTADQTWVQDLRNHLRANGVFVYKQARSSIATELCKVLAEDKPHKWTQEEIDEQVESNEGFNSILVRPRAASLIPTPTTPQPPAIQPTGTPAIQPTGTPAIQSTITKDYSRQIATLLKLYIDEMKYSG